MYATCPPNIIKGFYNLIQILYVPVGTSAHPCMSIDVALHCDGACSVPSRHGDAGGKGVVRGVVSVVVHVLLTLSSTSAPVHWPLLEEELVRVLSFRSLLGHHVLPLHVLLVTRDAAMAAGEEAAAGAAAGAQAPAPAPALLVYSRLPCPIPSALLRLLLLLAATPLLGPTCSLLRGLMLMGGFSC